MELLAPRPEGAPHGTRSVVADVLYAAVVIAAFALLLLAVRGLDRL